MTIEEFSKKYPSGTKVRFYPISGRDQFERTKIRSEPWVIVKRFTFNIKYYTIYARDKKKQRGSKMSIINILKEMIKDNEDISENLANVGLEFFDIVHKSPLYSDLQCINLTWPQKILGSVSVDGRDTYCSFLNNSIEISSFEAKEDGELLIHKSISIGNNTNRDVERFAGHDYIAPSVNNKWHAVEKFEFKDAMDILDVIDEVTQRTLSDQMKNIGEITKLDSTDNGMTVNDLFSSWKAFEAKKMEAIG